MVSEYLLLLWSHYTSHNANRHNAIGICSVAELSICVATPSPLYFIRQRITTLNQGFKGKVTTLQLKQKNNRVAYLS